MVKSPARAVKHALVFGVALAALTGAVGAGHRLSDRETEAESTSFHDMRVLSPAELQGLVDGTNPAVVELAARLETPERAFAYVRDRIAFEPSRPAGKPSETLGTGSASCLGKAALLASLYRAMKMDDEQVRVVTGQVRYGQEFVDHAWVELEHDGACLQQDPSPLLGTFGFDDFTGTAYTQAFVGRELFCFNDQGFGVVSQINRLR